MKIIYKNTFIVTFEELKPGDCFQFANCSSVSAITYMKMPEYLINKNELNTINLEDGSLRWVDLITPVIKLNAKLVIEN